MGESGHFIERPKGWEAKLKWSSGKGIDGFLNYIIKINV